MFANGPPTRSKASSKTGVSSEISCFAVTITHSDPSWILTAGSIFGDPGENVKDSWLPRAGETTY